MKPLPTKAQLRQEMERQIEQYLGSGGNVQEIPRGLSGRTDNLNPFTSYNGEKPAESRTPLTDVIKTMEERKQVQPKTPPKKRPSKRLITDDFGEPLRWVWDDK